MKTLKLKKILAVGAAAIGLAAVAAPRVSVQDVKVHYPWDGKADIRYFVTDNAGTAINMLVDVGPTKRIVSLEGDAAKLGNHTYTADLREMFGEFKGDVSASVSYVQSSVPGATGAATGILGDVMVIDVSNGSSAGTYPVNVYTNVDLGKFNVDAFKTSKIALLKIPAGTLWPVEPGSNYATVRTIAPQKDYWIGLFQVTEKQYASVMGASKSTKGDAFPAASVSYNLIRGGANQTGYMLPTDAISPDSFMGLLASKTGGALKFDLPTEAQWEIAARAGSTAVYGHFVKDQARAEVTTDNIGDVAWYTGNNNPSGTKAVGQKYPNSFGLYDTAGNVYEWCLDRYASDATWSDAETPWIGGSSNLRVIRGGYYSNDAASCRPSYRYNLGADYAYVNIGFRLCGAFAR